MKSLTVWHFSYEYLQDFLGYDLCCLENVLIFFPLQRFLNTTSFIGMLQALFFQESELHGFMDVPVKFFS